MAIKFRIASTALFLCLFAAFAVAQKSSKTGEIVVPATYKQPAVEWSQPLQTILTRAVGETIEAFKSKDLKTEQIAATVIDMSDPKGWTSATVNGGTKMYPASVVKMFYVAALQRQLEDGKIKMSPELQRGMHDMIVDSSNEATQYILDVITDTSSGAELPAEQFEAWQYKRNRVNRYFASMGYTDINVNQKTFCEDAYGIEQQSRNYKGQNRNMLTTNATARLLAEIVTGRMAAAAGTTQMMELLRRDPFAETKDKDDQAHGFSGIALIDKKMTDAKLWSKAGWTSTARHDAAYIETADGLKFVIVVFTEKQATLKEPIPMIVGKMINGLPQNQKR